MFSQYFGFITHTQTDTHMTGGSIFISKPLSLKPGAWPSQHFEIYEWVIKIHHRKERPS